MPKGPKGQKRPADVIGAAITVAKIATGEIKEVPRDSDSETDAAKLGREGGRARAAKLTADERRLAAQRAAKARWHRSE